MQHLKKNFCLSICFFVMLTSNGQEKAKDSLWQVWENEHEQDTVRLNALESYINDYYIYNFPDSAYMLYQKHLSLAQKMKDTARMAYSYLGLGVSCQLQSNFTCGLTHFAQAERLYNKIPFTKYSLYPLINSAQIYRDTRKYKKAILILEKVDSIAQRHEQWYAQVKAKLDRASYYNENGQYRKSIKTLGEIDLIVQKNSRHIKEHLLSEIYESKASTYHDMGKLDDAEENYLIAARLNHKLNFLSYELTNYVALGEISIKQKDTLKSIKHLEHAYKLLSNISNESTSFFIYGHYAKAYRELILSNYDLSAKHIDSCHTFIKKSGIDYWYPTIYKLKAEILMEKGRYNEAAHFCEKGLHYAKEYQLVEEQEFCLHCLSNCYEKMGQNKKAFAFYKKARTKKDSLFNENKTRSLATLEAENSFALERQETEFTHQKKLQKERVTRNTLIVGSAGSLLLLSLGFLTLLQRRKRKNAEKAQQLQEQFSQELLQNTEIERNRIACDLHDSINHKLLHLKQKANAGTIITEEDFSKIIHEVRNISHNLSPIMFEKLGLVKSIEELCRTIMKFNSLKISTQIKYHKILEKNQELQIYRIVEEALNNIIKHSKATHTLIKIECIANNLEVKIKDNGKGFITNKETHKKLNYGLTSIKQRAKSIPGILNINSIPKKGTEIYLQITS